MQRTAKITLTSRVFFFYNEILIISFTNYYAINLGENVVLAISFKVDISVFTGLKICKILSHIF